MRLRKIPYLLFIIATICSITSCNKKCKHKSTYWEIDKQATCTQNGSKHKECTVCHEKLDTEVIEALGHDLVHHEKKEPTDTEVGYKAYDTCTRCSYTTYEELPATGHTKSEWIIDVEATCTEKGSKHKECTVCHEKLITEVIEALGHDLVHHEKEDPTCTGNGHKAYDTCTRCSYTTYEEVPKLGHIYEDGICTRCGYELTSSDLLYELTSDNTGYIVTGLDYSKYDINALTIIIPSEYKGLPIVGIKDEAFVGREKIKKIFLPDTITYIGEAVFKNCKGLTSIKIPNSVISIGRYVFFGCSSLKSIIIPDSVTTMGKAIFENSTNLESVTIPFVGDGINNAYLGYMFGADSQLSNSEYVPSSLKEVIITKATIIDDFAFANCQSLKKVVIPDSVTTMGKAIFENSTNLESVTIPFVGDGKNNAYLGYMFGASNYEDNSQYVPISLKKVIIINATIIGSFAFGGCAGLTSIVIPNSVTSIGESAFGGCRSLTSVEIPNSVTIIGICAFMGCTSLTSIEIPNSVTSISSPAFDGCISLTNVYYKGTIEDWCNISFSYDESNPMYYANHFYVLDENNEYKELTEIVIPETITKIGDYQFYGFNYIKNVIISNSITSISSYAFSECISLTSIIVNENNPIYDSRDNCNAIIETKTNTLIFGCNNTIIPNTVVCIESSAFYGCTGLTSIKIPNSVTSIGDYAFEWCVSLTEIKISSNVTSMGYGAFGGCISLINIEIPNRVTSIGSSAFSGCTSLTSIVIPNSVTSIGSCAFEGCTSLTNVYYNGTIEDWCNISFNDSRSNPMYYASHFYMLDENNEYKEVKEIVIPETVTKIGNYQFYGFSNITNIIIKNSVTSIGWSAFSGCTSLTIYCEALEKPSGWANNWNPNNCNVVWGYKKSN